MPLATVIAECTINNIPAKVGDVVEVSEATLANLIRKGRLAEGDRSAKQADPEPEPITTKKHRKP